MDPTVAKRNAVAEDRLVKLETPPLREQSIRDLTANIDRTRGRYPLIAEVARKYGADPDELYLKYVIETRGEVDPENPRKSAAGAEGPFQIMPDIRARFEDKSIKDPFLRELTTAAKFYSDLQARNKFSTPEARAVAYNYGEKNLRKWGGQATEKLNDQSTNYIAYSRFLTPIVKKKMREGEVLGSVQPPPKLEEMNILEYYKRKADGTLRTPEDFARENEDYQKKVAQTRSAAAAPQFKEPTK